MPHPLFPDAAPQLEEFHRTQTERKAQLDTSTIASTISVDVLQALVRMAKPRTHGEQIYLNIARNALTTAAEAIKPAPKVDRFADQRPWDGPYEGEPSDLNYETTDHCDGCNDLDHSNLKQKVLGTMIHARGATGRVCPVLFLCHSCRAAHGGLDS